MLHECQYSVSQERSYPQRLNEKHKVAGCIICLMQQNSQSQVISNNLAGVLKELEKKDVTPQYFVGLFLNFHPEFQPFKSQHDADEFMQNLLEDVGKANEVNKKVIR